MEPETATWAEPRPPEKVAPPSGMPVIDDKAWASAMDLPCEVAVSLPAPGLRVQDLLGLSPGFLVQTLTPVSADVPLEVNGQLIAWCEFEVAHDRLAVRVTELA